MLYENSETLDTLWEVVPWIAGVLIFGAVLIGIAWAVGRYLSTSDSEENNFARLASDVPKSVVGAIVIGIVAIGGGGKAIYDFVTQNGVLGYLTGNSSNSLSPQSDSYAVTSAEAQIPNSTKLRLEKIKEIHNKVKELNGGKDADSEVNKGFTEGENAREFFLWAEDNGINNYNDFLTAYTKDELRKVIHDFGISSPNDPYIKQAFELKNYFIWLDPQAAGNYGSGPNGELPSAAQSWYGF